MKIAVYRHFGDVLNANKSIGKEGSSRRLKVNMNN